MNKLCRTWKNRQIID